MALLSWPWGPTPRACQRSLSLAPVVSGVNLLGLLLGCALTSACGPSQPAPPTTRPNIVLITIDTLRADRLRRGFTPAIDALADAGVRFDNARATVPLTLPSHVTLMTGLLPLAHGVRENGVVFTPQASAPPLARALRDAGYRTGGFVGAYVLDRRFGLADGFETYDDRVRRAPDEGARLEAERPGGEVADAALKWLNQAASPFFVWIHVYDPHAPYEPPAEFLAKAGGKAYDGEVAYADAQVARVIDAIRTRGLTGSTIVAIAGDHGEGLGEHGEDTHGMLAYDTTLRVPLVMAGPSLSARVVGAPVSLADLAPALRRLAGLPPAAETGGVDLLGTLPQERDVYAETQYPRTAGWHPLAVLAGERWKLVRSSETELYDLNADPAERQNVAAANAGLVQGMTARVATLQASARPVATVSADARERLRALGYVSGAPAARPNPSAPNPAKVIDAWTTFEQALFQINSGRPRDALAVLNTLATRFQDAAVFQMTYGRALKDAGRAADAVAVYRRAVTRIQDASLYHDLAVAARAAGYTAEALRAEQASLALDANNPEALNGQGLLQAEAGRAKEAVASFAEAARLDPSNASYWTNLGNAHRELSDLAQAETAYKRALDAEPAYADAANGLGAVLVQSGKPADAIPWFERAIKQSPEFYEARLNLGIALQESGQRDRAAAVYREILAKAPARFARERAAAADLLKQLR